MPTAGPATENTPMFRSGGRRDLESPIGQHPDTGPLNLISRGPSPGVSISDTPTDPQEHQFPPSGQMKPVPLGVHLVPSSSISMGCGEVWWLLRAETTTQALGSHRRFQKPP